MPDTLDTLDRITLFSSIIGEVLATSPDVPAANGIVEFIGEGHPSYDDEMGPHYLIEVPEWGDCQVFGPENVTGGIEGEVTFDRVGDWGFTSLFAKI
jgi:hypothetical protein